MDEAVSCRLASNPFAPEMYRYDSTTAPLSLKVRMLQVEVIETLIYRCVMWTLSSTLAAKL